MKKFLPIWWEKLEGFLGNIGQKIFGVISAFHAEVLFRKKVFEGLAERKSLIFNLKKCLFLALINLCFFDRYKKKKWFELEL